MTSATNRRCPDETRPAHDLYGRWLLELWRGDQSDIDELVSEDFVGHWPDGDIHGRDGLRAVIDQTRAIVRDLRFELVVEPFAERDLVAARWTGYGESDEGPVSFTGNDILRIRAGKVVEYWVATTSGAG